MFQNGQESFHFVFNKSKVKTLCAIFSRAVAGDGHPSSSITPIFPVCISPCGDVSASSGEAAWKQPVHDFSGPTVASKVNNNQQWGPGSFLLFQAGCQIFCPLPDLLPYLWKSTT